MKKLLQLFTAVALSLGILTTGVAVTPQGITTTPHQVAYAKTYPITVISSHLSLHRGNVAYVTIKGKPKSRGSISVIYKSGPSKAKGLQSKLSNKNGIITWSWLVGGNTTKKTYTIHVYLGGKSKALKLHVY